MSLCYTATGDRVFENADGVKYEDGRLCVTTACIDNTIDFYGSRSFASNGAVPALSGVALTPSQVWNRPYFEQLCVCS